MAANREERYDRPSTSPQIQPGETKIFCGIDQEAGGTWLGINEHGLFCAVTNRKKLQVPQKPRSRGVLCKELLACESATIAADLAMRELQTGKYAGANYICLDDESGVVVYGGNENKAFKITPGVHIMTNADFNDPADSRILTAHRMMTQCPFSDVDSFLLAGRRVCSNSDIVTCGNDRGTVSSSVIAISNPRELSKFFYASGSPDREAYVDISTEFVSTLWQRRSVHKEVNESKVDSTENP